MYRYYDWQTDKIGASLFFKSSSGVGVTKKARGPKAFADFVNTKIDFFNSFVSLQIAVATAEAGIKVMQLCKH